MNYIKLSKLQKEKRDRFYFDLRCHIQDYAYGHQKSGYCIRTVIYALEKMGFSSIGIKGQFNNVDRIINKLQKLSETNKDIQIIQPSPGLSIHQTVNLLAAGTDCNYVIIAALANYLYSEKKKGGWHHVGIVIPGGEPSYPLIAQGGLIPEFIDRIEAPASWSFSWGLKNKHGIDNKDAMIYIKYGVRK